MKRKIYFLPVILSLLLASACVDLTPEVRTTLAPSQVYWDYTRVQSMALAPYSSLQEGFANIDGAMMASTCDEAEHTQETSFVQKFNTGAWNPLDNPNNIWPTYFRAIRLVNDYLQHSDSVNLDFYRLDPSPSQQTVYLNRKNDLKRWKYENRFLRAFFYFELVKRYGGVPIIKNVITLNDDLSTNKRNSLAECIQFISDECDSAASVLPLQQAAADLGRATKGAALALKSRVLLYAASDLFNSPPTGYANPELVSMPTGDRTARWQKAADAANAVINLAGTGYSLATNYRNIFLTFSSPEIIFTRRNAASNTFETASFPIGFDGGKSGTTPSQNLVDAYEVKINATTAVPFDWNNPVHSANPYSPAGTLGRDPRLDASIITNNSQFKGGKPASRAVECWTGGRDGKGVPLATRTGYYLKKYVDEALDLLQGKTSVHSWIYIRYAEMLLNYAEALNESQGPATAVYTSVSAVRARAGVAMPPLQAGLSQAKMRDAIRNERRVEFAFEDMRPWDVRRWKLGNPYFNAPLKGVEITNNAGTFTYVPVKVEDRVFESKMYFYPIPQSELNVSPGWVQNPGW
jgi:hypothetical protein